MNANVTEFLAWADALAKHSPGRDPMYDAIQAAAAELKAYRRGRLSKSAAKTEAARKNGQKGGRPRQAHGYSAKTVKQAAKTAAQHADADLLSGLDWLTRGCQCGACRITRIVQGQRQYNAER